MWSIVLARLRLRPLMTAETSLAETVVKAPGEKKKKSEFHKMNTYRRVSKKCAYLGPTPGGAH